jgi:mRNA interferase MazF
VVLVPFPYSDQLAEKRRPAVVVSNEALHQEGYLWLAMVTGAGKPGKTGDIAIADHRSAGLPATCMVRTAKLANLEPQRVLRRVGSLSAERRLVQRAVAGFLA